MVDELERHAGGGLKSLRPALDFLTPYRWRVVAASFALMLTASVTLAVGQGLRLIIDQGFQAGSANLLKVNIGVLSCIIVVLAAGTYVRYYFVSWIGERVSADIRNAVYAHLIHLHPGFFETNSPSEIQSRITTDTTLLQTVIGSSISIALRNALMFLGGIVLLVITNARLSMLVLICAPLVVMPIVLFGRRVRRLSRSSQDTLAEVGVYAGESLRHIKLVHAFNHQRADIARFSQHVNEAFNVAVARIRQRAWLIVTVMVLVLAAIAVMLWIGGQEVLTGRTSAGELTAFIFYAVIVAASVGAISEIYGELQRAAGATERLVELLSARSDLAEPEYGVGSVSEGTLQFDGVYFAYPTRSDVDVLSDVSFKVSDGEMVALVGPSGAGKSTVLELAQRFYDVTQGSISFGGVSVDQFRLDDLRRNMAYVPQDAILFGGSIGANLRYGDPTASDRAVKTALEAASADFVFGLREGLGTHVGESGRALSGGERQRIAIARALIADPRLLILDEATSALDARSEEAIRRTIARQHGERTVVIVAHRLSTVVQADRIIVFDGGRIVGEGSHDELLANNTLYRQFASVQNLSSAQEVTLLRYGPKKYDGANA
ncbi:MAG TPA: ATP-binding cassette domain-containing protein [Pseudomonadales bacterium]|nr:ATP-binding cassette domain-containing protein [Pseudomonadales bacterium]